MITLWRKRKVLKALTKFTYAASISSGGYNVMREGVQKAMLIAYLVNHTSLFQWRPRRFNSAYDDLKRKNDIYTLVEDCIKKEGEKYIDLKLSATQAEELSVNGQGRDLLESFLWLGYWEAVFSKYSKTTAFILGGGAVGAVWLLKHFLSLWQHS